MKYTHDEIYSACRTWAVFSGLMSLLVGLVMLAMTMSAHAQETGEYPENIVLVGKRYELPYPENCYDAHYTAYVLNAKLREIALSGYTDSIRANLRDCGLEIKITRRYNPDGRGRVCQKARIYLCQLTDDHDFTQLTEETYQWLTLKGFSL